MRFGVCMNVNDFIVLHNMRRLCYNIDAMKQYINDLDKTFDVIDITETWLKDDMNWNDFALDNYTMKSIHRLLKKGCE